MRPRNGSASSSSSCDSRVSISTSDSSFDDEDDDERNARVTPFWPRYRAIIEQRGFHLDTFRDVKEFYERYWEGRRLADFDSARHAVGGYTRACRGMGDDDNALCRDAGLVRVSLGTTAYVIIDSECPA